MEPTVTVNRAALLLVTYKLGLFGSTVIVVIEFSTSCVLGGRFIAADTE